MTTHAEMQSSQMLISQYTRLRGVISAMTRAAIFVGTAWGLGPARSAPTLPPPASTDNAVNEHYASKCPTISRTTTTEKKKTNGQCDRIKIAIHSQHQRRNITSPTYSLLPLPWHLNL